MDQHHKAISQFCKSLTISEAFVRQLDLSGQSINSRRLVSFEYLFEGRDKEVHNASGRHPLHTGNLR
jgi:hypothetical protein